uniref:Glycosyltransferase 1 domain containing 1 n=1 Tax=Naja naja TaxID=35670 RepID=A0A8C6Y7B7_NAJNA
MLPEVELHGLISLAEINANILLFKNIIPSAPVFQRDHLQAAGHLCILKDTSDYESPLAISNLISSEKLEAALGIHLFKAGRLLQGSPVPFGIIFGGTDVNEDTKNEQKAQIMEKVLDEQAAFVFLDAQKAFDNLNWQFMKQQIYDINFALNLKILLIFINPFSTGIAQDDQSLYIFLLICGLRRVKDPLYLLDVFSGQHFPIQLLNNTFGMDDTPSPKWPSFWMTGRHNLRRADGVHLLSEVPQEDLHAIMKNSFAVVNSSISEGMSAAILEAMDLNVPVLARDIPGNAAVIVHQTTGLLYSTPQEFVQQAKTLMKDPVLYREVVRKAHEYVLKHHSWEKERKVYQNLVLRLHECSCIKEP